MQIFYLTQIKLPAWDGRAVFEIDVSILFELEFSFNSIISSFMEFLMENSFVFFIDVWFGAELLRA